MQLIKLLFLSFFLINGYVFSASTDSTLATQMLLNSSNSKCNQLDIDFSKNIGDFNPDISFSGGLGDGCVGNTEFWATLGNKIGDVKPKMMRINAFEFYKTSTNPPFVFDYDRFAIAVNNIKNIGAKPFVTLFDFPVFVYLKPDSTKDTVIFNPETNDSIHTKITIISHNWAIPPLDSITKWIEYKDTCKSIAAKLVSMGLPGLNYEVWNEPEGFWDFHLIPSSEQWKAYNVLYKYSSKGILEGDPTAKIGGPATRMNQLESFLNKYEKDSSQLDFISWHQYNDDYSFTGYSRQPVDKLLDKYNIPRTNMKYFITEYNFYGNGEHAMNDAFYNAGNLARIQNFFRADSKLSGLFFLPRNIADAGNNTGAFTLGGNYPKPSYNFFKLYSKMAGTEVNVFNNHSKINAWASLDNSQGYPFYRVLLWSFASNYQTGALVNTKLVLKNIPNGQYTQTNFLIDSKHGNYQYDLASNITPAGELKAETKSVILKGNDTLNYKMENGAVELIEFIPVN